MSVKHLDGDRYLVRVYNPTGSEYRRTIRGKRAAHQHEAHMRTMLSEGSRYDGRLARTQVIDYAHTWIEARNVKPVTRVGYHRLLITVIQPHLPTLKLGAWRHTNAQRFVSQLARGGAAVSTQRRAITLLRSIFHSAVRDGALAHNPFDGIPLPRPRTRASELPTWGDVRATIQRGGVTGHGALLLAGTGMRAGELCAAGWDDIDFDTGMLHVQRTLVALNPTQAAAAGVQRTTYLARPKSAAGERHIPLPPTVIEYLKALDPWGIRKVTLPHYDGGTATYRPILPPPRATILKPTNLSATMTHRAGYSPHRLRHLYATTLEQNGVPLATVQAVMGHAPTGITLAVYTHVQPHTLTMVRDIIEERLTSASCA